MPAGMTFGFAASMKGRDDNNIYIFPVMFAGDVRCQEILAFSYIPMYMDFGNESLFVYDGIEFLRKLAYGNGVTDEELNEMLSLITEITEEEFYKID